MTIRYSRREFLRRAAVVGGAAVALPRRLPAASPAAPRAKMKLALTPSSISVRASGRAAIALAIKYGFDAVEPNAGFLGGLNAGELSDLVAEMKARGVTWAAAGLPVDFRGDDAKFRAGLEALPKQAAALKRAGVDRVGTWLSPTHAQLDYGQNLKQHAGRLRAAAKVLKDHGQRLGLEYVGTPSLRENKPHTFVHSLRQLRELLAEIGADNVGCVLDSWHWWTAGETEADLLRLRAADVISVDLNDAPDGIPLNEQQDGQRELPCATGVIPVRAFLNALTRIGYDGPVRAEPFNKAVNDLDDEAACAAVIKSLRKAMGLVG